MTAADLQPATNTTARPIDYPSEWPAGSGRYAPNDRQAEAHRLAPYADELLYGGARGGGKTDFALAEALRRCLAVAGFQAVFFRRTYPELSGPGGAIPRLLSRIPRNVGRWNGGKHTWRFYNGSVLAMSYLETLAHVQAWLGLELQLMIFDQVEQIDEETYVMVRTSLRASGELATAIRDAGLRPASLATANPGGRGHMWVKRRWIDAFPTGGQLFRAQPTEDEPSPSVRVFVPAKLADNPALDQGDPTYRARLQALPAEDRKAQLDGDWNVYKGARFGSFRTAVHVRRPEDFRIEQPDRIARVRGVDYGSSAPFVCLWLARTGPDDLVVVYREAWRQGLTPAEQAQLILDSELEDEHRLPLALDPSCWAAPPDRPLPRTGGRAVKQTGPPRGSIAASYQRAGLPVTKADNRRIDGAAAIAGRLTVQPDGLPRLIILETCPKLIETLPALQRDPKKPEDVDVKAPEDHWYDALRYGLMLIDRTSTPGLFGVELRGPRPTGRGRDGLDPAAVTTATGLTLPGGQPTRGLRTRGF